MIKKLLALLLVIINAFSLFIPAAIAENTSSYELSVSSLNVNIGESITFNLKTPLAAAYVNLYLDGEKQDISLTPQINEGYKQWQFQITMDKTGTRTIRFYIYDGDGKLLAKYPKSYVKIHVTCPLLPPVTSEVQFIEYDRAVLTATPAAGLSYKRLGFYFGASEASMTQDIRANSLKGTSYNKMVSGLMPNTTYYYQAYALTKSGVLLKGGIKTFTTPAYTPYTAESAQLDSTQGKYEYLFHSTKKYYTVDNPPLGYKTAAEAREHMVSVTVPVWVLSGRKKKASAWTLTVNRKLAANVKAIFNEIYALDIQFPVMYLHGYSYRKVNVPWVKSRILSHHSFGAAIDLNRPYNLFYRSVDRRSVNNPYTIPQAVIDIFEKYGWAWGGDFDEGLDTMHFQYLGLDLLP